MHAEEKLKAKILKEAIEKSSKAISKVRDGCKGLDTKDVSVYMACWGYSVSEKPALALSLHQKMR
jgi:hypothetical protein